MLQVGVLDQSTMEILHAGRIRLLRIGIKFLDSDLIACLLDLFRIIKVEINEIGLRKVHEHVHHPGIFVDCGQVFACSCQFLSYSGLELGCGDCQQF